LPLENKKTLKKSKAHFLKHNKKRNKRFFYIYGFMHWQCNSVGLSTVSLSHCVYYHIKYLDVS